jgi:hypothetical protein
LFVIDRWHCLSIHCTQLAFNFFWVVLKMGKTSRTVNPPSCFMHGNIESFMSIFFHSYNILFERNSKKIITRSGSFF